MIDYLKDNWKTVLVGAVVAGIICWGIWGCEKPADEALTIEEAPIEEVAAPAVEETPAEEAPAEAPAEEVTE